MEKPKKECSNCGMNVEFVSHSIENGSYICTYCTSKPGASAEVTRPLYYCRANIECWDYILANNIPFMEGNIIKYVTRWQYKNGIKDLYKALEYLKKLIETEENKKHV